MDDRKRPAVEKEEGQRARLFVPQGDLTTDGNATAFLSDRQMLAWAYRTETEVRFRKLQGRGGGGEEGGQPTTISTTLDSKYLLDLYPKPPGGDEPSSSTSALERDRYTYCQRRAIPFVCRSRRPDGSLVPLVMGNFGRKYERLQHRDTDADFVTVPPNLLVFEMLLEAFMGYNLRGLYNSKDPTMPRAAVMGGAVVAALTAWRLEIFRQMHPRIKELLDLNDERKYLLKKSELIREWNNFFLYNQGDSPSRDNVNPFSDGDVDIFLQASPLTRALNEKLMERGLTQNSIEKISEFCGGVGLCQTDLQRFSAATMDRLRPKYHKPRDGDTATFVFSLARNGLSFLLTPKHENRRYREHEYYGQMDDIPWARTTQLIMLNHRADLLGALMDFDLSIATCAYDGTTVRLTPRAAYSLQTLSSVVTPFTVEETRNRKRIVKYFKRGFTPYLIDPCCQHKEHCLNCSTVIENFAPSRAELRRGGPWKSRDFHTPRQLAKIEVSVSRVGEAIHCCDNPSWAVPYSMAMFEEEEGDATKFLARIRKWDAAKLAEVEAIPYNGRVCCRRCRNDYAVYVFIKNEYPVGDDVDDYLRGEKALMLTDGWKGMTPDPSFYCGGTFDSTQVRKFARSDIQAREMLFTQCRLEKIRYVRKHGTVNGYQQRFTYGDDLDRVFNEASQLVLPGSNRAPVGLNPERFISRCQSCFEWLHDCEFGTLVCEQCASQKPAAKK